MAGVVLYGPPAAGKDTITRALCQRDDRFELYRRLKIGPGRTDPYRMITGEDLIRLQRQGGVVYRNHRYGAVYVTDEPTLRAIIDDGRFPVVHAGQPDAVAALRRSLPDCPWLVVSLWCPKPIARQRAEQRGSDDVAARMRAWDETEPLADADLELETHLLTPAQAAATVVDAFTRLSPSAR